MKRIVNFKSILIFIVFISVLFFVLSCLPQKHFLNPDAILNRQGLIGQIDANMADMRAYWNTPGVAVALIDYNEERVVWSAGYGVRTKGTNDAVDPATTIFQVGSISKPVASWGLMRLTEDRGDDDADDTCADDDIADPDTIVDLYAPVTDYLTNLTVWHLQSMYDLHPDWVPEVTLRRILGHRAGLNVDGYLGWPPGTDLPTLEESLNGDDNLMLYGPVRVNLEPDTKRVYSGGGYTIMQLALEKITNQDFAKYMHRRVLCPLGMTRSSYEYSEDMVDHLATPYDLYERQLDNFIFTEKAAAGLYTTVEDLARFAVDSMTGPDGELPGRNVLHEETVEAMTACYPDPDKDVCDKDYGWGIGYEVKVERGVTLVGHTGGNRGWKALFRIIPEKGVGIVVLTNADGGEKLFTEIEWAWKEFYLRGQS